MDMQELKKQARREYIREWRNQYSVIIIDDLTESE